MIIIGYQGIGKSTLANICLKYIDLENSAFWIGKRHDDWHITYTQIAENLSKQGYVVFVSSYEVVRNTLKNSKEKVICCVPAPYLKDQWINKLKERYNQTNLDKDYKAYKNAEDRYTENVNEIMYSGFDVISINEMDYDLRDIIEEYMRLKNYKV